MKFLKVLACAVVMASVAISAFAAPGSWTNVYSDKANGVLVYTLSTTTPLSTPPLPLQYKGSQVVLSVVPVSATSVSQTIWATLGGPIGVSTSVTGNSATLVPQTILSAATGGSVTTLTTQNPYHDIGVNITPNVTGLVNVRAVEIRQPLPTAIY